MSIPNVSLNDSVKIQNNPTAAKQNAASTEMKSPEDLQRQPQEDNFNGKGLDKKKIITYVSIGTVLATLLGVAADLKFTKGKYINKLWNKLSKNVKVIKDKNPIAACVEECKNLTFDSPNLKLMKDFYGEKSKYDLGIRYAIVAHNTEKMKGSGVIIQEVPEIFKGLNKEELIKILDNLRLQKLPWEKGELYTFSLGGKKFDVSYVDNGSVNRVFKITDSTGRSVCYKYTLYPLDSKIGHGIHNETAITIEANKAGVKDVNKLYMANILSKKIPISDGYVAYSGGWQLTEFIDGKTAPKPGLHLHEWLTKKGLLHNDIVDHEANQINGYIVDMGGIIPKVKENPYSHMVNVETEELKKYIE